MTVNHVVIMSLTRALSEVEKQVVLSAANAMKGVIPVIRSLECGFDMGLAGSSDMSFSLIAKFNSAEDYKTYASHPAHVSFVHTHIKPILAENGRRAIQYVV